MDENTRLVKLPRKGRILIFADVHGDMDDYKKCLEKWDGDDCDCHIVFAGDFIHSIYKEDDSVDILEDIIMKSKRYDNFHVLLGNHEWSHIANANLFKGVINQKKDFEDLIVAQKGSLEPYLTNYINFFKSIPFFIQTDNGVFISHAGPSVKIETEMDYEYIVEDDEYYSEFVHSVLFSRPVRDYSKEDVSNFLDIVKSNVMVVGHNVVEGYETFGKQLILCSSFGCDKKMYLDIDLTKTILTMDDLKSNLKCLYD